MTRQADGNKRIYFDHAATTAIHPEVMAVLTDALENNYGNPSSFYKEGNVAARAMNKAREKIAELLDVKAEEIFFTSGGTESDNWAIKGAAQAQKKKGKHLITSTIEHHAVLHSMEALEKDGYEITYLEVDSDGLVRPDDLRKAIRPDTILVSIMYANNEIGTIQPIKELGEICQEHKVLFHSDAVQALGAVPLRPKDLGVDLMSFSGHKLYGPKGIGILYKRKGARIAQFIDGGAQERKQRGGTENVPSMIALAKAVEIAYSDMEGEAQRQIRLRDRLINEIPKVVSHAKLNGHPSTRLPNNVNFSFEFIEGESILLLLDAYGYACSSGSACTSASLDPSHVLLAIGLPHEVAHGSLRISLGRENTDADVDRFLKDLPKVIQRLRDMSPLYEDYKNNKIEALIPHEGGNSLVRKGGYGI
ncbi:MAG: cysteine desulfurase NifS [Eubacteriales bacterium]|nr:cysteine desulfurase NifS [Eubacteriales bacterium]MDD4324012.1 cysteine desulfurase NifS [Eubacteriales bacterium]MDD4540917.1 cysteine desulfurase NifS [Eubacteriales bacterium]